ncbi:hypothetical protein [Acidocella aromatica]|uniref:Lipoprotein n=1 Tax=Acidocella aromatica TaxID=1303579 RepID=A0A840VEG5_9PROT|nr:hypothetical protein [Acidocella aromatica]MBB5373267.1 hypothetical protein [Acidocella aromatica]
MKRLLAALPLCALAACSSSEPPPSFAPLDYSYLRPITLKVANLSVVNNYVPGPDEAALEAKDPAPPGPVLLGMLQHRLQASGQPGSGTVTIQNASITQANGNLNGAMTVDLNLTSADGRSTGFAEASVTASQTAPDSGDPADMQAALYQMTKRLMDQMNVQLPYQILHNVRSWVVYTGAGTGGGAAASGGAGGGVIQASPLSAPAGTAVPSAPALAVPATGAVNTNTAVPNYLPGAGPAALGMPAQ